jgi:hypothetical protein
MITEVKWYLKRNNGRSVPIKELIEHLDIVREHYSNPKAGLYNALTSIENADKNCEVIDKNICFSLTEEACKRITSYWDERE